MGKVDWRKLGEERGESNGRAIAPGWLESSYILKMGDYGTRETFVDEATNRDNEALRTSGEVGPSNHLQWKFYEIGFRLGAGRIYSRIAPRMFLHELEGEIKDFKGKAREWMFPAIVSHLRTSLKLTKARAIEELGAYLNGRDVELD
jgi:hypothetical protein